MIRRQLVLGASACVVAVPVLTGCSPAPGPQTAAQRLRERGAVDASMPADVVAVQRELVRNATLAPSSHNTQCWTFRLAPTAITIAPDLSRRCLVVDPDNHHLFVSLGCATENLAHAALAHGLQANARFEPSGDGTVLVDLAPTAAATSPLFAAIAQRQSTRGDYDAQPLTADELRQLQAAGSGQGVRVELLTERPAMERVLEFVVAGNNAQMANPAFVAELTHWIRFGADEAVRTGDGLFTGASGNPVVPRWLGQRLMGYFFTPKSENDRYARQVRNSAGIAVFVSEVNDAAHWVEAGRCYERFALQATALGIRNAHLNQPVEAAGVRPAFATALGLGAQQRPDLVVRFGRGPLLPYSLRRPLQSVLV
jgi:hypothetical protein